MGVVIRVDVDAGRVGAQLVDAPTSVSVGYIFEQAQPKIAVLPISPPFDVGVTINVGETHRFVVETRSLRSFYPTF